MYKPVAAELVRVKSRISADSWQQRVEQAQSDEALVQAILDKVANGMSLNAAIAKVLPANRRSWALRRIPACSEQGFLTAAKLTAAQLISFVLREYLPSMPMTPLDFVQRALSVHGRKEVDREHELVVFYENPRDPLINEALRNACERIDRRELRRGDRRLRFAVEPSPAKRARFD